jgi:hypothetical protein
MVKCGVLFEVWTEILNIVILRVNTDYFLKQR